MPCDSQERGNYITGISRNSSHKGHVMLHDTKGSHKSSHNSKHQGKVVERPKIVVTEKQSHYVTQGTSAWKAVTRGGYTNPVASENPECVKYKMGKI